MKANYILHDKAYIKRKAQGRQGWAKQEQVDDYLRKLEPIMQDLPKEGKLLELGCGDGVNSLWLAERGFEVTGVDIAPSAIQWADEKLEATTLNVDFQLGNVLDLKNFADETFDFVLDGHCFHCIIGQDREAFLQNAHRVLKKNGIFIVTSMCGEITSDEILKNFDLETRNIFYGDIISRHIGFAHDILRELKDAGFHIQTSEVLPKIDDDDCDDLWVVAVKN